MFKYNLPLRYLIPLLLLLFSAITLIVSYVNGRNAVLATVHSQLETHFVHRLHLSQHILEEMLRKENYGVINPYISAFGMDRSNRLALLVDGRGIVLASTKLGMNGEVWRNIMSPLDSEFLQSIESDAEQHVSQLDREDLLLGYIKVCGQDGVNALRRQGCGFFYQVVDAGEARLAAERATMGQATLTGIGGLFATVILALILYRLVTRRSEHMIAVTQRFSNGDHTARTEMRGSDELACVGEALDSMFQRIIDNQQRLRVSEASLNRAQRIAHLGNWEWDIDAGTLLWSDEVFRIFGEEPQSFAPSYERFMEVIHPEDREKVQDAVAQAIGDAAVEYRVEHRVVLADQSVRYIQESGEVTRNAEGKATGMIGTVLDITERVKTEEELELFQLMIEKSADPVFLIDADDNFRMAYVNEAAIKHYGAPRKEILTWHIPDWDPNFSYESLEENRKDLLAQPGMTIETTHRVKGGEIVPVEVSLNPVRYRGRRCQFGYFRNISERKEVERRLSEAKERAEEATRIKSQFLANMSHEIRTPMNAIINLSYLAQQERAVTQATRSYLRKIDSSANHLLGIINDILDFSKIEAGKLMIERLPFELHQLLDALSAVIGYRVVEQDIEVLFRIDPHAPNYLLGDPLRITQVLTNLLSNAIKFTESGEVILLVTAESQQEDAVSIRFEVSDTGRGMSSEEQRQLFKPFTQADSSISRKYGGTGLGLVITQRLVQMMGGSIRVESHLGQGSRFTVELSLELGKDGARTKVFEQDDYPDLSRLRVLVADDNATARMIFRENLSSFGIENEVFESAEALIQRLVEEDSGDRSPVTAVVLDWKMPQLDGVEAARIIRQELGLRNKPRILLCSAYGDATVMDQVQHGTVDGTLSKPFSPSSLLDGIATMMGYRTLSRHHSKRVLGSELKQALERRRGAHILVVEDNEINQEIARQLLQKVGMQVCVVPLAAEAFKRLEEQRFDLVLMDIQMPEMDGLEATRYIRRFERYAGLPVVAMTAHALERDREMSLAAGMNDHLTKPINPVELYQSVCRWIAPLTGTPPGDKPRQPAAESAMIEHLVASRALPGIDVELAVGKLGGNHTLYRRLLRKFRDSQHDAAQRLTTLIAAANYEEARMLVHSIKGVAGNLGAAQLCDKARLLEQALNAGADAARRDTLLQEFVAAHREVMEGLAQMEGGQAPAAPHSRPLNRTALLALLADLEGQLEDDLGRALALSAELGQQLRGTLLEREYLELESRLTDFNMEAAQESLAAMRKQLADTERAES